MPQSRKGRQVQILLVSSGKSVKGTISLMRSVPERQSQYSSADHYRKVKLSKQCIRESLLALFSIQILFSFISLVSIENIYQIASCTLDFTGHGNCQIEWQFILYAARAVLTQAQALMKFISFNSATIKHVLHK